MSDTSNTQESEIKQQALTIVEQSKAVTIRDQETYDQATSLLLDQIKPFRKRWKDFWYGNDNGPVPLAYRAYKSVLDKFNQGDTPLEAAEKQVKAEIARFDAEQEKIRQQKQREAEEAARKAEEEERLRVATLAEESGASDEEVNAIVDAPVMAVAPPVEPTYQKASGISSRDNYKCRVTDIKALCKAIGAGKVPANYVLPNEPVLNARARADQMTLAIPGCVPWNDKIVSGRTNR